MISNDDYIHSPQLRFDRGTSDLDRERALLIREYFAERRARMYALRAGEGAPRVSAMYDSPSGGKPCVWMQILRAAEGRFNPLWSVSYHIQTAMTNNQDINAYSMAATDKTPLYISHGLVLTKGAAVTLRATVKLLRDSIPAVEYMYRLTPLSAIEYLRSSFTLDPVLELAWRYTRGLPYEKELATAARMSYACVPSAYMGEGFTLKFLEQFALERMFDVDHSTVVSAPAVDGVLEP